ncbi:hypothetical protein C8J56DRAFT_1058119 [Mycena floridula]|nr:hypothetical protein C8J56DRAFT_1058119 [Mycena floridula]
MCRIGGIRIGCEGWFRTEFFEVTSGSPYTLVLGREWIQRNADLLPLARQRYETLVQENAWAKTVDEEIVMREATPPDELSKLWNSTINDSSLDNYWNEWIQHNPDQHEQLPVEEAQVMSVFVTPEDNIMPNGVVSQSIVNPANDNTEHSTIENPDTEVEKREEAWKQAEEAHITNEINARIAYSQGNGIVIRRRDSTIWMPLRDRLIPVGPLRKKARYSSEELDDGIPLDLEGAELIDYLGQEVKEKEILPLDDSRIAQYQQGWKRVPILCYGQVWNARVIPGRRYNTISKELIEKLPRLRRVLGNPELAGGDYFYPITVDCNGIELPLLFLVSAGLPHNICLVSHEQIQAYLTKERRNWEEGFQKRFPDVKVIYQDFKVFVDFEAKLGLNPPIQLGRNWIRAFLQHQFLRRNAEQRASNIAPSQVLMATVLEEAESEAMSFHTAPELDLPAATPETSTWSDKEYETHSQEVYAIQIAAEQSEQERKDVATFIQLALPFIGLTYYIETTWKLQKGTSDLQVWVDADCQAIDVVEIPHEQSVETRATASQKFYQESEFYHILKLAWQKAGRQLGLLYHSESIGLTQVKMRRWLIKVKDTVQDQPGAVQDQPAPGPDDTPEELSNQGSETHDKLSEDSNFIKPSSEELEDYWRLEGQYHKEDSLHSLIQIGSLLENEWVKQAHFTSIGVWIDREKRELHAVEFPLMQNLKELDPPQPLNSQDKIQQTIMHTWKTVGRSLVKDFQLVEQLDKDYGILNHWIVRDIEAEYIHQRPCSVMFIQADDSDSPVDETTIDDSSDEGSQMTWERELMRNINTTLKAMGTDYYSEASEEERNAPGPSNAAITVEDALLIPKQAPAETVRVPELIDLDPETHVQKLRWVAKQFGSIWNSQNSFNKVEIRVHDNPPNIEVKWPYSNPEKYRDYQYLMDAEKLLQSLVAQSFSFISPIKIDQRETWTIEAGRIQLEQYWEERRTRENQGLDLVDQQQIPEGEQDNPETRIEHLAWRLKELARAITKSWNTQVDATPIVLRATKDWSQMMIEWDIECNRPKILAPLISP